MTPFMEPPKMKIKPGVVSLLLLLVACSARSEETTISIKGFQFVPEEITVPAGSTVTWVNHDDTAHSIADKDKALRSGGLDTDDRYSFSFPKAGTYTYYCTLHPQMTGTIHVQ
jgi:plastocyanin